MIISSGNIKTPPQYATPSYAHGTLPSNTTSGQTYVAFTITGQGVIDLISIGWSIVGTSYVDIELVVDGTTYTLMSSATASTDVHNFQLYESGIPYPVWLPINIPFKQSFTIQFTANTSAGTSTGYCSALVRLP